MARQQEVWANLQEELREAGIAVLDPSELTEGERAWLDQYFIDQVFPILTPLAIDPAHPFPFIPNGGFSAILKLQRKDDRRPADGAAAAAAAGRPLRAPARLGDPLPVAGRPCRHLPAAPVPGLRGDRARRVPPDPRQRRRDQRGGRGSRAALRERAEAPPPRRFDLDLGQLGHAGRIARLPVRPARDPGPDPDRPRLPSRPHAQHRRRQGGDHRRPAGPQVRALCRAFPRAHPRLRRRLLRRHPRQGHRRPSSLRELRRRRAVPAPGGARSGGGGDQADALPHQPRLADRQGADLGGRGRQDGDGAGRAQGALRRGGQHPLGARPRTRRRAGRLRLHRPQDPRQGLDGGAARGPDHPYLRAFRHRQLSPDHRPHLYRPVVLHLRSRDVPRRRAPVQLHDGLCPARADGEDLLCAGDAQARRSTA